MSNAGTNRFGGPMVVRLGEGLPPHLLRDTLPVPFALGVMVTFDGRDDQVLERIVDADQRPLEMRSKVNRVGKRDSRYAIDEQAVNVQDLVSHSAVREVAIGGCMQAHAIGLDVDLELASPEGTTRVQVFVRFYCDFEHCAFLDQRDERLNVQAEASKVVGLHE